MLPPFRPANVRPTTTAKPVRRSVVPSRDSDVETVRLGVTPPRVPVRSEPVEIRRRCMLVGTDEPTSG